MATKQLFKQCIFLLLFCLPVFAFAQEPEYKIRLVEIQGEYLGNLKADYAGSITKIDQFGFGISTTIGKKFLGGFMEYDFRRINLSELNVPDLKRKSLHELYIGLRYYPMRPTFMPGKVALRITGGAALGMDLEPNFRTLLFAGVAISPLRSCSGGSVCFVYRPGVCSVAGYPLKPSWTIRLSMIIGPTMN
jgi:hypothetical protein